MEASSCFLFCFWCLLSRQSSLICVWPKFITKTIKIKIKQVKNEFPWLLLLFGWGFTTEETEKKCFQTFPCFSLWSSYYLLSLSPFLPGQQNECVHIQSLTKVFLLLNYIKDPSLKFARALLALPNPTSINLTMTEPWGNIQPVLCYKTWFLF